MPGQKPLKDGLLVVDALSERSVSVVTRENDTAKGI